MEKSEPPFLQKFRKLNLPAFIKGRGFNYDILVNMSKRPQRKTLKIRSSPAEMFYNKEVLKKLAKFTEKHLYWSLFLVKVTGWSPATLLKRDSSTGIFW